MNDNPAMPACFKRPAFTITLALFAANVLVMMILSGFERSLLLVLPCVLWPLLVSLVLACFVRNLAMQIAVTTNSILFVTGLWGFTLFFGIDQLAFVGMAWFIFIIYPIVMLAIFACGLVAGTLIKTRDSKKLEEVEK